jgi:hypothetical protein
MVLQAVVAYVAVVKINVLFHLFVAHKFALKWRVDNFGAIFCF